MLYISLFVSALLLMLVNIASFRKDNVGMTAFVAGFFLSVGSVLGMCFLPLLAVQAVLLLLGAFVATRLPRHPSYYLAYSCLATLGVYGVAAYYAHQRLSGLRQAYPLESLVERLPARRPAVAPLPASDATRDFIVQLDSRLEDEGQSWQGYRRYLLRQLHEDHVQAFVNSPGFGLSRMPFLTAESLKHERREERPVPQPGPQDMSSQSSEPLAPAAADLDLRPLQRLHLDGVADFVNPAGFGAMLLDRRLVGFQAHSFSKVPQALAWKVQTIALVGLVVHEHPLVYLSDNLPQMSELRQVPTRPPDSFELAGLESLATGENLFVRSRPGGLRLLGGIRAGSRCVACHEGNVGDLLGALSYTLRGSPPEDGALGGAGRK